MGPYLQSSSSVLLSLEDVHPGVCVLLSSVRGSTCVSILLFPVRGRPEWPNPVDYSRVAAALCLFFTSEGGSGDRKRGISQICCNGLVGLRRRGSLSKSVSFEGRVILGSDSFKGCILHLVSSRDVLCFTGVSMYASGWLWSLAVISFGMNSSMNAVFLEAIGCLDLVGTFSSLLLSCLLCIVYTLQRAERK